MQFGKLLASYRLRAGINQKKLSSLIPMNQSYLSRIENGTRKPPPRDLVVEISKILELNPEEIDELLTSANYHPQSLFDLGFGVEDATFKRIIGALGEIKNNSQLVSYLRAKEELWDYLEFLKLKYTNKIDRTITRNALLAEMIYSKVHREGMNGLSNLVNKPLGGAIVMFEGKILLAPLGISPNKGAWLIPAGFVNPKKGDKTAKDIAVRLVKRYLGNIEIEMKKELTAPGEVLEGFDSSEYCLKVGYFPIIAQIYKINIRSKTIPKALNDSQWIELKKILKHKGEFHPLLSQILKPYIKNNRIVKEIYLRGEEHIDRVLKLKDYEKNLNRFYKTRIKRPNA